MQKFTRRKEDYIPQNFGRPNWKLVGGLLGSFITFLISYVVLQFSAQFESHFEKHHNTWIRNVYLKDREYDKSLYRKDIDTYQEQIKQNKEDIRKLKCYTYKNC